MHEALAGLSLNAEPEPEPSPVFADGHIYLTARRGIVTVVKAGPEFSLVSTNELGEEMSASPAVANGRIYLRTFKSLYAIGK